MKTRQLRRSFKKEKPLLFFLLPSLLALGVSLHTAEIGFCVDKNLNRLNKIEKTLFFKTYDSESLEKRVERLEKRFFGEAASGEVESRIDKIYKIVKPQIEAAETEKESQSTETTSTENNQAPKIKTDYVDPKKEKELDKKRLAVLQARDEEIRVLLKEGIKYWKKKDAKNAENKFLQVVRLDPRNDAAFFSLGVLYEANGALKRALQNYNKAHNINPNRLDYKDAIVVVKAAIEKKSKKSKLAIEAAQAFKRKEYISALELYKRLEKQSPKKAIYKYNIGTIYLLMKSPEQALEYYGKAKKLDPKEPRYVRAYEKLNKVIKDNEAARVAREKEWDRYEKIKKINERKNFSKRRPAAIQQRPPGRQMPGNGPRPSFNQQSPPGFQPINKQPNLMPPQVADSYFRSIGVTVAPCPGGIKINTVEIGSRAAVSGIKPGDIIISVDGRSAQSISQMATIMSSKANGQKAQLIVKRQGQVGQILF